MSSDNNNSGMLAAAWHFFASVKLAVAVLLTLAGTSVIGTLIPQNAATEAYIDTYGVFATRLLSVFDLFNMYHSGWFQFLIGLLSVNIVVCTIRRWPGLWKIISSRTLSVGSIQKKQPLAEFSDSREPQNLDSLYQAYIQKRFQTHQIESDKKGFRIYAEKGRWTRLGVPIVHLSILFVLAGAMIGSIYGFDGSVNIPEGGSADHIQLSNRNATIALGFEVRCDDFDVSFYETGAPKEFRSSLVVLENGQKMIEKDIIVNDPLRYKGINLFQSSYGTLPPKNIGLSFTPKDTGRSVQHKVSIGQTVELPNGSGQFYIREFERDYHYKGTEVGEAVLGVLSQPGREPTEIVLPLRFPSFDKMRKGDWTIAVEGHDNRFYTGLQVTKDPGVPLVYAGFILLIAGCWITFFMSNSKIMIDVKASAGSSRIQIFGASNRNRIGFETRIDKMGKELSRL